MMTCYLLLHYPKHSHIQSIRKDDIFKSNKATQHPDTRDEIMQTQQIQIDHKATHTYDDQCK